MEENQRASRSDLIRDGKHYLKIIDSEKGPDNVQNLSDSLCIEEEYVNEAVRYAKRERMQEPKIEPNIEFIEPKIKTHYHLQTGEKQEVTDIEIELMKELFIHFGYEEEGEFTTMIPVRVKYKRK